jgi:hypothetical protein
MLVAFVTYAADVLRPWLGVISAAAAACFLAYLLLHAWVNRRPLYVGKPAAPGSVPTRAAKFRRTAAARTVNGFVGVVDLISLVLRRVSFTAAFLAVAGFAAIALSAPATAGAGAPLLKQAQQALKQSLPAAYANVADLSAPKVTTKGTATVYTFTALAKPGDKKSKPKSYTVTVDKDGSVQVGGEK